MTVAGLAPDRALRRGPDRADAASSAATWRASSAASAMLLTRSSGRSSGRSTALLGTEPRSASRTGRATPQRARLQRAVLPRAVPDPAHPGHPSAQPAGLRRAAVGPHVQHDGVVRHEHQLAVLRRRDDDVVPHADGRPGGAELRLGGRRHRRRDRGHPRASRARGTAARQLLGRPRRARCSTCCCRSRSSARCSSSPRA